jgi:hypothetical protein
MHTTRAWHSPRRWTRSDSHCSGASHNSLHLTFFFAPSIGCMPCSRFQPFFLKVPVNVYVLNVPLSPSFNSFQSQKKFILLAFIALQLLQLSCNSLQTLFQLFSSDFLSTYKLSSDSLPTLVRCCTLQRHRLLSKLSSNSLPTLFRY